LNAFLITSLNALIPMSLLRPETHLRDQRSNRRLKLRRSKRSMVKGVRGHEDASPGSKFIQLFLFGTREPMGVWQRMAMNSLKFHLGPPMPHSSTPCRWATPETTLWPFQGWPAHIVVGQQPSSTHLDSPRRTPKNT
jgi:hypothetical protein